MTARSAYTLIFDGGDAKDRSESSEQEYWSRHTSIII